MQDSVLYIDRLIIRPIAPGDRDALAKAHALLSDETVRRRFLAPKPRLAGRELTYLTEVDGQNHFAIGAKTPGRPGEGLGVARFVRLERPDVAEAAVAVVDRMHGRGLGRLLFQRMCAAAAERGIERLRCELLSMNAPMRALVDSMAPEITRSEEDGIVTVEFPLPDIAPDQSAASAPRQNPLYQLLVLAAQGMVAMRRMFEDWVTPSK